MEISEGYYIKQLNNELVYSNGQYELNADLLKLTAQNKLLLKKIDPKTFLNNPLLHLTFKDSNGRKYHYKSDSTKEFRNILDFFPNLLDQMKEK